MPTFVTLAIYQPNLPLTFIYIVFILYWLLLAGTPYIAHDQTDTCLGGHLFQYSPVDT